MRFGQAAEEMAFNSARASGYEIRQCSVESAPDELESLILPALNTLSAVRNYKLAPPKRIAALVDAVRYVSRKKSPGAIVECGVWRGGSMMAVARTLLELGEHRDLYLFDTFAGMTAPSPDDIDHRRMRAEERFLESQSDHYNEWCYASLEDVRKNLFMTGYPEDRCHFVEGDVLDTIPAPYFDEIAILRLDTDWYESTRHELVHLYPKLARGGVLIIDDYGHWQGCRKAVDEYFKVAPPFFFRIDYTGRMAVRV